MRGVLDMSFDLNYTGTPGTGSTGTGGAGNNPSESPPIVVSHFDGTAHPDGGDWSTTLPQEAADFVNSSIFMNLDIPSLRRVTQGAGGTGVTEIVGPNPHGFQRHAPGSPLGDGRNTGGVSIWSFPWSGTCCIHGYVQVWRYYFAMRVVNGGGWLYDGVGSCPHTADDEGPHGGHLTTTTPIDPPAEDPVIPVPGPGDPEEGVPAVPLAVLGNHHHAYTDQNDPFGIAWNHRHSPSPHLAHTTMLEGSGGWPEGQNAPNQTYTHAHAIGRGPRSVAWNPRIAGGYSPSEGSAGGWGDGSYAVEEYVGNAFSPSYMYDHDHDGHGIHTHLHWYTHTHYADEVPEPELWRPYYDTRPSWWEDGMEDYLENPRDWSVGQGDGFGGNGVFPAFPAYLVPPDDEDPGGPVADPQILAQINAIAAGYNPELIFLGGDVFGVQGYAEATETGLISGITITDPGATVVAVTEGTIDDVGNDGIVSPEIILTKPTATDAQLTAWALDDPAGDPPFSWFNNFAATAHVSDNPTTIARNLGQFFKSEADLRAEAASSGYVDPIAQTFMVNIEDAPNGLFIASVDLCFQNKPPFGNDGDPVTVEIRTTVNGYPSSEHILSGYGGATASRTLNAAEVNVADGYPTDARRDWENPSLFHSGRYNGLLPGFSGEPYAAHSLELGGTIEPSTARAGGGAGRAGGGHHPNRGLASQDNAYASDPALIPPRYTRFVFPSPIFLSRNTEYAIVVRSNSMQYKCWVSDARTVTGATSSGGGAIGGSVEQNFGYTQNPNLATHEGTQFGGSFFKSHNGRTWTADQNKDLMFRINRADFVTSQGIVEMSAGHNLATKFEYDRAGLDAFSIMAPESTFISQVFQAKTTADDTTFTVRQNIDDMF